MSNLETVTLRPAQEAILAYTGGRLAISAVPGSGKTFTLTQLAANLIASGRIDPTTGEDILIVTYLNASVDTFNARLRGELASRGLPPLGFDVRTLHSLGLEIMRQASWTLAGDEANVMDEVQATYFLGLAVDAWIVDHRAWWERFAPADQPQRQVRWREVTERMARAFIRAAKNERFTASAVQDRFAAAPELTEQMPLVWMLAGVYGRYQAILERQAVYDFDDLIWLATEAVVRRPDLAVALSARWPYVLEDEAQDSVPLQEALLGALTGPEGNWVRVGDPNQAITSTFTAAHPRHLRQFMERADVVSLPLPASGRSAPIIYEAANRLVAWTVAEHPVPEVRANAFLPQAIQPTPPGDAQPNPAPVGEGLTIRAYGHREEEELPGVADLAARYLAKYPDHTAAILVPTHATGHALVPHLDRLGVAYDNLLRGGVRVKEIAAALQAMLALLANPLDNRALVAAHAALRAMGHPAAAPSGADDAVVSRFEALLRGVRQAERLLFPTDEASAADALPAGVAGPEERAWLETFTAFLRGVFDLRPLPIDDLVLALSDLLFLSGWTEDVDDPFDEADLALAYHLATVLRHWRDVQPEWRLPELSEQLADIARGRRALNLPGPKEEGYAPEPGRVTLATQHGAKGLEWDAVFLVGVDARWIPNDLEGYFVGTVNFLGDDDPLAEVDAQLRYLMAGDAGIYPGRTATESAHIDVICERLRLLYVGLTRGRRFVQISRSRQQRRRGVDEATGPATAMSALYEFLKAWQE